MIKQVDHYKINPNENQNDKKKFGDLLIKVIDLHNEVREKDPNNLSEMQEIQKEIKKIELELVTLDAGRYKNIQKGYTFNLTNQVHIRSYFLAIHSLKDKLLGWGFDNYEFAFEEYKYEVPTFNPVILYLNTKDASNNFAKMVTEFGFFALLIFAILALISFDKKIPLSVKIFLIPMILTQLIRGAGYFNGGFILSIAIYISIYLNYRKKKI